MDANRFDNLETAALIAAFDEARREGEAIRAEIIRRLIAESGIVPGRIYRVANDGRPLSGRLIKVSGVNAGRRGIIRAKDFWCFAYGRMNGKSAAGDGWTIRQQNVDVSRLTPVGE